MYSARGDDRGLDDRLDDLLDLARRELRRVHDGDLLAVLHDDPVDDARRGGDEVEVELAAQPLGDDLQVEQAEEADPEAEAQRGGRLRLVDQGGVVELELVQGVAQVGVVAAVDREQAREHHGLGVGVAAERLGRALDGAGHRVADLGLADVLDPGDEVADLADPEPLAGHRLRGDHADLEQVVDRAGRHHLDLLARAQLAVDDADVGDDAAVGVVDGVEDHRAGGRVGVADRGGHALDDAVQQLQHAGAGLARGAQHVLGLAADQAGELLGVLLGLGRGQVDLVEDRDDLQVVAHGHVEVGQGLRLDALRGVDEQHGALARGQRARHLVGEVDVAGRVDHVEGDDLVADLPRHPDGLALDGDAALALDVHPVQVLRAGLAGLHDAGQLQHPVRERRLAVVDVRDDAEVPQLRRGRRGDGQRDGGDGHGLKFPTPPARPVPPRGCVSARVSARASARPGRPSASPPRRR